jgi:glucose/mannose transport system substrate-binding protein
VNKQLIGAAVATLFAFPAAAQQSVEVLPWWTSGGEAAMTAVRARVTAGNPPTAVQMLGFDTLDRGKQGVLADLNAVAAKEGWDKSVPTALQRFSKLNGKWIAAPVNIHPTNWIWANKEVLAKAGVTSEPKSFGEFIAAAEKVQKAGFIAIAHGGQPWQEATVFDSVVLATGGVDHYRKAFIELDSKAIASPTTEKEFQRMSQLRELVCFDAKTEALIG